MLETPMLKRSCCAIIILLALWGKSSFGAEKAAVFGTPTANIRVGPGVEHAIVANLKENDTVVIEKLEGEWYLVTSIDGVKGYMHKNLLKLGEPAQKSTVPAVDSQAKDAGKSVANPAAPLPTTQEIAPQPGTETKAAPLPTRAPTTSPVINAEPSPAPVKSSALIKMAAGRETELLACLGVSVLTFLLGWLCGGVYALRRERLKRTRLIF